MQRSLCSGGHLANLLWSLGPQREQLAPSPLNTDRGKKPRGDRPKELQKDFLGDNAVE